MNRQILRQRTLGGTSTVFLSLPWSSLSNRPRGGQHGGDFGRVDFVHVADIENTALHGDFIFDEG